MPWWGWIVLILAGLFFVAWKWPRQFEAVGNALSEGGQRMQALGCGLTLLVTLPIIGLIFFGFAGLIGGVVIGLLFGIGMIGQAFSGESK